VGVILSYWLKLIDNLLLLRMLYWSRLFYQWLFHLSRPFDLSIEIFIVIVLIINEVWSLLSHIDHFALKFRASIFD
jgi:hypothetical protein